MPDSMARFRPKIRINLIELHRFHLLDGGVRVCRKTGDYAYRVVYQELPRQYGPLKVQWYDEENNVWSWHRPDQD